MFDNVDMTKLGEALSQQVAPADAGSAETPPVTEAPAEQQATQETTTTETTQAAEQAPVQEQVAAPQAQDQVQPSAWQDAIKDVPVNELLKAAGFDDKMVKLYDLYKNTGDLKPYFEAYNTDYDKLSDADVLRLQFQEKYAMLSPDEQTLLYEAEMEKYQLDPEMYDDRVVKINQIRLKADVAAYRDTLKQKQAEAIIPKADLAGQQQSAQQSMDAGVKEYVDMLQGSDAFKAMQQKGVLQVGSGDNAFNIGVDPNKVFAYLTDPKVAMENMMTADGKPDFGKQFLLGALATNTDQVLQVILERGRQMEKLALAKELGNETPAADSQNAKGAEKSGAQLFAERFLS